MREILFRAKRLSDGVWVEGDLSRCVVVGETHIRRIEENLSTTTHKVDTETVCQYTGLTDKNGRKIFEGDIVQENVEDAEETGTDKFIYSVLYSEEHTAFTTSDVIGEGYFEPLAEYINSNAEVIGNIFDNPELIGEQP